MIILHKNKETLLDLLNKKYEIDDQNLSYDKERDLWRFDFSNYNRKIILKVLNHVFPVTEGFKFSYNGIAYYKGVIYKNSLLELNSIYQDFILHLKDDPHFFAIKSKSEERSRFAELDKTLSSYCVLNIYYLKEEMPKHLLKLLDTYSVENVDFC